MSAALIAKTHTWESVKPWATKPARDLEMVWHLIFNARPPVINPLLDCNINVVFGGRETDIWGDHIVWEQRENKSLPTEYQDRGVTIKH